MARRLGVKPTDLVPQTTAWTMLGVALSAYEHWLADGSSATGGTGPASLQRALGNAFDTVSAGLAGL